MATPADTTDLFVQAFSKGPTQEMPRSAKASGWRVKAGSKLSFTELMLLDDLQKEGVRWDDSRLDSYRDLGAIALTDEAKKEDQRLTQETGFDVQQRNQVLNVVKIEAEILAELLKNPAMDRVVEVELKTFQERFGDEGMELVKEDAEAAAVLHRRRREAELATKAEQSNATLDVAQEIQQAQEQIAAMNAAKPASEMSREELQAALLKLDAAQRSAGDD